MGEASCDSRRTSFVVRQWTRRCCNGLCGGSNDRPPLRGAFPVPRDEGRLVLGQGRAAKGVDCARIDHVEEILRGDVKCQAYPLESLARWVMHATLVSCVMGLALAKHLGEGGLSQPRSIANLCQTLAVHLFHLPVVCAIGDNIPLFTVALKVQITYYPRQKKS